MKLILILTTLLAVSYSYAGDFRCTSSAADHQLNILKNNPEPEASFELELVIAGIKQDVLILNSQNSEEFRKITFLNLTTSSAYEFLISKNYGNTDVFNLELENMGTPGNWSEKYPMVCERLKLR